jgi:DNA polymerase III delta subunit
LEAACVDALVEHAELISRNACVVLLVETELSLRHALAKPHAAIHTERFPAHETPGARPFAFTDALGVRDLVGALAAARDQVQVGKEPLELLGLVAWKLNRWVLIKRLVGAGYSAEQMGRAIGLRPWHVERMHSEVMSWSLESLTHLLERCWQLDVDAKSGRVTPGLALEQLVIEVCAS